MPIIIAILSLFTPRFLLALIYLFSHWFSLSYKTVIWPLLGFFIMPYTTLTYMGAMLKNSHQLSGGWLVVFIIAVVVDLLQLTVFRKK